MGMFSAIFKRVWCKKEEGRRGTVMGIERKNNENGRLGTKFPLKK